jgi:hypothetical protein
MSVGEKVAAQKLRGHNFMEVGMGEAAFVSSSLFFSFLFWLI